MSAELLPCLVEVQKEPSKLEHFTGSIMLRHPDKILITMSLPESALDLLTLVLCLFSQKKIPNTCFKLSQTPGRNSHLLISMNNGTRLHEKLVASLATLVSTIPILFINSLPNSSLITEEKFIEKSLLQELMLTLDPTFSGMKQLLMSQKL